MRVAYGVYEYKCGKCSKRVRVYDSKEIPNLWNEVINGYGKTEYICLVCIRKEQDEKGNV